MKYRGISVTISRSKLVSPTDKSITTYRYEIIRPARSTPVNVYGTAAAAPLQPLHPSMPRNTPASIPMNLHMQVRGDVGLGTSPSPGLCTACAYEAHTCTEVLYCTLSHIASEWPESLTAMQDAGDTQSGTKGKM